MQSPMQSPMQSLPLDKQVAQMVMVHTASHLFNSSMAASSWLASTQKIEHCIKTLGVGGVILQGGTVNDTTLRIKELQSWARIPLFVAADVEEGVGQRFAGATQFPPPLALARIAKDNTKAVNYAEQMGRMTAQEACEIGINWLFAPVVDVNNNPCNPVINVRAFGETPAIVSQLAQAFIRGAQAYPVLTTAKHFPGHGDTSVDSHVELPILSHSLERLKTVELPPFQAAIAAGVDAVMSAHLQIPAWDEKYPATLSHRILTQGLRQTLNFNGLIITDALVMGAIANRYGTEEAAVLAVEAGADVLLMPPDAEKAIQAVCRAVASGRISPQRIQNSVQRIEQAKNKLFNLQHRSLVETILQDSTVTLGRVPLSAAPNGRNLIIVDEVLGCSHLRQDCPAIALPASHGYHLEIVDKSRLDAYLSSELQDSTLVQVFARGNPFREKMIVEPIYQLIHRLIELDKLQAVVIYGNPYLLDSLTSILSNTPCIMTYGQMFEAQSIALEQLFSSKS